MEHIVYVVIGVITELISCSLPEIESRKEHPLSLLSILIISGDISSILGLVVPKGNPRYVKGIVPMDQPKVAAKCCVLSGVTLIGIIEDLL